jgi:hypothetical protein
LAQLQLNTVHRKEWVQQQQTAQEKTVPVQETVQIIALGSEKFCITQDMLQMDEEIMQKKLKYIYHLDLVLPKIPTKALYKLQVSVA